MRYEITGSGVGSDEALSLDEQAKVLKEAGAKNIREAYHLGLSNQPMTLRFSAVDDEAAVAIGNALDKANNPTQSLMGGGGLLRAYGLHWQSTRVK